jgi:uncharacterized protein (DUF362 family)
MDRRDFLKVIAAAGVAFSLKLSDGMEIFAQSIKNSSSGQTADLVAIMGGEPEIMFRRAITEIGGMGKFVKKGCKVCVKPNIGWDKTPEFAANTNPKLVAEIVEQALAAGASEVTVFDHTCDEWKKCYKNSGIEQAAKKAGAKILPGNDEGYYHEVPLPKGKTLKNTKVHSAILDCDVWINVPVLKHHGGANMSLAMKNHMGIIWDRRIFHNLNLQQCIADVCTLNKKPVLNVIDGYRLLKQNGPQGKTEMDVVLAKALFISQDIVAVDTAATKFFNNTRNMPLEDVGHLSYGEVHKLGTMNLEKIGIKRIKL